MSCQKNVSSGLIDVICDHAKECGDIKCHHASPHKAVWFTSFDCKLKSCESTVYCFAIKCDVKCEEI